MALHSLPSPRLNRIQFRPDASGPVMLELSTEHIQLTGPDGQPLFEARADGTILVKGVEKASSEDCYDGFRAWMEQVLHCTLQLRDPGSAPAEERGPSKLIPLKRQLRSKSDG